MKKGIRLILAGILILGIAVGSYRFFVWRSAGKQPAKEKVVRVGYFPNITHAQAIIGLSQGTFQKYLGKNVRIETKVFNAGPSEIEALFAGSIDIGYIGPGPAINGYVKSGGQEVRIVSGAALGGASLVVQPDIAAAFASMGPQALQGAKIASPQQGNTQDLSLRHYLSVVGLKKSATIIPVANADQVPLFQKKEIDGAWAPEPWATILTAEAGGKRIIDERSLWKDGAFSTTVIIVRKKFLQDEPQIVRSWLTAHAEVTKWITDHPQEARLTVNSELEKLTSKKIPASVLDDAWNRLSFSTDPAMSSIASFSAWARDEGFIATTTGQIDGIFDLSILHEITGKPY
jgi:NitT/TauT family transport system substrate-binding protein